MLRRVLPLLVLGCLAIATAAPVVDENAHLGVATCASSNCHGKLTRSKSSDVWLNEYRVWRSEDYHSRAYKTLSSAASKLIAKKLGLTSATTANICLDCHADNVPPGRRGTKFQISDGVSCEACHGGAEHWIATHDNSGVTHEQNVRNGMYPTDRPADRARLCLSCHMGSEDRFATHRILGAGHPRLSFELENFTANQPPHFSIDDDYRNRKGRVGGAKLWITGQIEAARRYLVMLESAYLMDRRWMPELAFYDCQSCHHGLDPYDLRWLASRRETGLEPGSLRLQDHHLRMLEVISQVLTPERTAELVGLVDGLVLAGQTSRSDISAAAEPLAAWIANHGTAWLRSDVSAPQVRNIRRRLLANAASGQLIDYGTAEQGLLAIVTLTTYLGEEEQFATAIDKLFAGLGNDETFKPAHYSAAAIQVESGF
jgi:hypothetical protein